MFEQTQGLFRPYSYLFQRAFPRFLFVSDPHNRNTIQVGLISTHFHKYDDVCSERNGVQIETRRRGDAVASPPPLFATLPRRPPPAYVIVLMKGTTQLAVRHQVR
jgi:hypothetical protein